MLRTFVKDIKEKVGQEVLLKGFVHTLRDQGSIKFLLLRDISGITQVVILKSAKDAFDLAKTLSTESVVEITGLAKEEKQAPGGFEVAASSIKVLSVAAAELPIPVVPEKGGGDTEQNIRWDWRWLDLRNPEKLKIFQVWTSFEKGFREQFEKDGFMQVYMPAFMNTASESGAEVFEVKYFDRKAYLAQSPQFYKQMAMASGFEKVFCIGPVFRAEPSYTTRHMTEYTGWDFEMSYVESHEDVMAQEERLLVAGFKKVNEDLGLGLDVPAVPFPKMTMKEVKAKLKAKGVPSEKDGDLSPEEERELSKLVKEELGHDFVFVTEYPASVRAFYHMRPESDNSLTKSFDLMYKGVEITTGAQREHRPEILEKQALEKGMELEPLQDYLNFFRYGCPPHGGVGMGPARMIMKMLDIPTIKEVTFLPRDVKRLRP